MDELRENLKKVLLAGVGAVAVAAEKTRDALDDLSKKGEVAVEKGKAAGEELKSAIQKKLDEMTPHAPSTDEEIGEWVDGLSDEARKRLYEKLKAGQEADDKPEA